jgi:hypothetical protein
METTNFRKEAFFKTVVLKKYQVLGLCVFLFLLGSGFLKAEDQRNIPLDLYLIVDASEGFREARDETVTWINTEVIDRLLQNGDRLVIWSAGDTARIIHSETIGSQKDEAKQKLKNLEIQGRNADFSAAIREAASRSERDSAGGKRISYTLLVSGSAKALAPALEGSSASLFRWSRAEKYSRWQAMVVAPNIGEKVRQAAAAYMSSR